MTSQLTHAMVRKAARTYQEYYEKRGKSVSLSLADTQHRKYVDALRRAGLEVDYVEADDTLPDCVFIEDTAVVWESCALITRMHQDREGEQAAVEEILQSSHAIEHLSSGARLEGGDVLHIGDTTYVGLSTRTNKEGANELRAFLSAFRRRVIEVPVESCLHLKSAVTYIGDGTIVIASDLISPERFDVTNVINVDPTEANAANCLRIKNHLVIADGYPKAQSKLLGFSADRDIEIISLNISEFEKGDGSLSCLSIMW